MNFIITEIMSSCFLYMFVYTVFFLFVINRFVVFTNSWFPSSPTSPNINSFVIYANYLVPMYCISFGLRLSFILYILFESLLEVILKTLNMLPLKMWIFVQSIFGVCTTTIWHSSRSPC